MPPNQHATRPVIFLIMGGLLAWALFHAVGAYFGGPGVEHDFHRPLLVLGCMFAFLGCWLALLAVRQSRVSKSDPED